MNYAKNTTVLNKRLPAYVGVFVLLLALGITIVLSGNTLIFISKATVGSEPKNIHISNISDTSFTISYTTDADALGTLSYGTDPSMTGVASDDRNQTNGTATHQVHFITVKRLSPLTKYYYAINSGGQKTENNGAPYEITTSQTPQATSSNQPTLSGNVSLSDGSLPAEAIVYVSNDSGTQLATLTNPDGSYQLSLNQFSSGTSSSSAALSPDSMLKLQVQTPTEQSDAKVLISQANRVPKIVLSQNYDYTLSSQPTHSIVASASGFPVFTTNTPVSSPDITTPTNAQAFKDRQPLFQGKALPNTEVDIVIRSIQEISTKVQSDTAGSWKFRPPTTLAPGKHTITIISLDASGVLQTISRSFTVYAAGSKFIEPSISPVATPTTAPSPTIAITPTAIPTVMPTATPAPTQAATPTTGPTAVPSKAPIPKTGSSALITGIAAGIFVLGIGALLFFLSIV